MRIRKPLSLVVAAALALVVAVVASGDIIRSGQYFGGYVGPGQGGHTAYGDGCSSWWVGNKAYWPGGDAARVTYIDLAGGWHYTFRSTISPASREITVDQSKAIGRSKLRCENASDVHVYNVACYFLSDNFTNCV